MWRKRAVEVEFVEIVYILGDLGGCKAVLG
jgi:hypothetical protein